MTFGKMVRSLSVGLLFGILAIGLLPFLVIFNWAEMLNLVELESPPIIIFISKFIEGSSVNKKNTDPSQQSDQSEP